MYTTPDQNVYLDAIGLAEGLFGSHMMANMITIGAAYQAGVLPLTGLALEHAIRLNGVAVEMNLLAFQVGRLVVAEPDWDPLAEVARGGAQLIRPVLDESARRLLDSVGADGELQRLLEIRIPELIAYQNEAYAASYVDFVKKVRAAEQGDSRLSEAVARYLYKLMAYKDEYEVARLHLRREFQQALEDQFGANAAIQYQLHPPLLKALGLKHKIGLGRWFNAGYWLLTRLKGLRGGSLDIFGYAKIRRLERALIAEYKAMIIAELATLTPAGYDRVVQLAELPDMIRGYEDVKLRNVARYRAAIAELNAAHTQPV
jgi:indolepyruvate ferredoxin oxidoreductase